MNIFKRSITYKLLGLNIAVIFILCVCVYFVGSIILDKQIGQAELVDDVMAVIVYILIGFGLLL